jgi:hypothetical protein
MWHVTVSLEKFFSVLSHFFSPNIILVIVLAAVLIKFSSHLIFSSFCNH